MLYRVHEPRADEPKNEGEDLEQDIAALAERARETIEEFVVEQPHAALGIAAAAGFRSRWRAHAAASVAARPRGGRAGSSRQIVDQAGAGRDRSVDSAARRRAVHRNSQERRLNDDDCRRLEKENADGRSWPLRSRLQPRGQPVPTCLPPTREDATQHVAGSERRSPPRRLDARGRAR